MNLEKDTLMIVTLGIFGLKELYSMFKNSTKENTKATMENTLQLVKLEVKLDHITELIEQLPKIKKDLSSAHEKIRAIEKEINN